MTNKDRLQVAQTEGIAQGLLIQVEDGIKITGKGKDYILGRMIQMPDIDRLLLAGYFKTIFYEENR